MTASAFIARQQSDAIAEACAWTEHPAVDLIVREIVRLEKSVYRLETKADMISGACHDRAAARDALKAVMSDLEDSAIRARDNLASFRAILIDGALHGFDEDTWHALYEEVQRDCPTVNALIVAGGGTYPADADEKQRARIAAQARALLATQGELHAAAMLSAVVL